MKTYLLLLLGFLLLGLVAVPDLPAQSIRGQVFVDGTDAPVADAEILVMGNGETLHAFTDETGNFAVNVPAGTFVVGVRIISEVDGETTAYTEYYDDAMNLDEAQFIMVDAGQAVEGIVFGVPDRSEIVPASTTVTVTGIVQDESGQPLAHAIVMVSDYEGILIEPDTAWTDATGQYTLTVPRYVQRLKAWTFKAGYHRQFYADQPSHNTSTEIFVDPANPLVSGIDFTLEPVADGGSTGKRIRGEVTDEDGVPLQETLVVGFHAETEETRYALTDREGRYELSGLAGGTYYVLFVADGFAPEFFGNGSSWQDAQPVPVEETTMEINARLGGLNRPPIGRNTHSVMVGVQRRLAGIVDRDASRPAENALITVDNEEGEVVAFDLTDTRGYYEINDLEPGSYTVHANRVRFDETTLEVELAEVAFYTQTRASLTLSTGSVTSTSEKDDLPSGFFLRQNYPNPFNPSTAISFDLPKASAVTLVVYDATGREVARLVEGSLGTGRHQVTWDAKDMPSGVYFYRLTAGSFVETRAMTLVK